jgi:hypothetical protein
VDDEDVAVGAAGDALADAALKESLEEACLAGADNDQIGARDCGVAVLAVAAGVDDGDGACAGAPPERRDRLGLVKQLFAVAALELLEAFRAVAEPAAQLLAGGELARPCVDPCLSL